MVCYISKGDIEKLKAEVIDKDRLIAKLMRKQFTQPQDQSLNSVGVETVKETSTVSVQFNYMIPSIGKRVIVSYCVISYN